MKKFIVAGIVFLLLITLTLYKLYWNKETGITATGTIEVTDVDITTKVSGYLKDVAYESGDNVEKGTIVAKISRPDLEIQVIKDEAALKKAQFQLADLKKGPRIQELEEAKAALNSSEAVYKKTKSDYDRYKTLHEQGAISAQAFDNIKSSLEVALNSLTSAKEHLSLVEEGTRPDLIEAQEKEVERSRSILEISRSMLEDTVLTTPITGTILSKNYENGEFVAVGSPVYTIADLSDCWVKIYVASSQLGLIKLGEKADVKIDSYPDKIFKGTIKEISQTAEFTPRQSITQRERANLVFAVEVKLENKDGILKPGMPADVVLK